MLPFGLITARDRFCYSPKALPSTRREISSHFTTSQMDFGDYNVSEIDYTGHGRINDRAVIAADRDPFASLTFAYEKASRPMELYVGGHLLKKDQRLTDIYSCVSDVTLIFPFNCKSTAAAAGGSVHQTAHYKLDYSETQTASRFVVNAIHMFGEDDAIELQPTRFTYSEANPAGTRRRSRFLMGWCSLTPTRSPKDTASLTSCRTRWWP